MRFLSVFVVSLLAVLATACGHQASVTAPTPPSKIVATVGDVPVDITQPCVTPTIADDDVDMSGPHLLIDVASDGRPFVVQIERRKNDVYYPWQTPTVGPLVAVRVSVATWFDTWYRFRVRYADCPTWSDWRERYVRPRNVGGDGILTVIATTIDDVVLTTAPPVIVTPTGPVVVVVVDVPLPSPAPGPEPTPTQDPTPTPTPDPEPKDGPPSPIPPPLTGPGNGNADGCNNGSSGDHNADGHKDCGKGNDGTHGKP